MKKLLTALATAATAALGFAEITRTEGFEDSSYTAYDNDKPSLAAPYDFEGYGDYYRSLDDDDGEELLADGASCVDAVMQFKYADAPDEFEGDEKLVVFANSDGKLVVVDADATNVTTTAITEDTWYRLTIVSVDETVNDATVKKFKVYVNGVLAVTEGGADSFKSRVANSNSVTKMTLSGTGKVDNFVARTTNPFGGAPAGWIANIGTADPEQYFTDYTKALEKALAGATLTFADGVTEMDGTAAHPFEIRTAADLVALQQAVATSSAARAYNYLQTADIDMSDADAFPGIGTYDKNPAGGIAFTGVYDGGSHKISNVTMTARNYGGIFNQVVGGTIKNLAVENISVASGAIGEYGYAIVGHAANGATLQNLTAAGSFLSSGTPGTHNMAGIVVRVCGGADSATVTTVANCTNNAAIYGAYTKLAGVCAIAEVQTGFTAGSVLFQNCSNTGALTSSHDSTTATGFAGILAYSAANTVLDGCTNTGTLSNTSEAANTDVNGSLVGTVQNNTLTLKSAVASGDIGKFNAGCTVAVAWNPDSSDARINFNDLGNANTKVEIVGVNGAFIALPSTNWGTTGGNVPTILPEIVLSANWTVNNGWNTTTTLSKLSGTGNLTVNGKGNTGDPIPYTINSLDGYTGTLAGVRSKFTLGDIVVDGTPAFGDCLVKLNVGLYEPVLTSATVNGAAPAAPLCRDTLNDVSGVYLTAAQVVADDNSTTGYASVANALDAADAAYASTVDAAYASTVNVLDTNAEEVEKTGWSYDNGVYTSTRAIATLKGTTYPSLTKALAAAAEDDEVVLVGATSESVTIPAGVTVAVTDDVAFSGKLSGSGAIKYTKAPASFNVAWFVNWTGTFVVAWDATNANGTGLQFNTYGVEGSVVEIAGDFTGYPGVASTVYASVNPTVKITGSFTAANGSSATASVFKKITGSGTLTLNAGNKKYAVNALEDWTGAATVGNANCVLTNLVSGTGSVTYSVAAPEIWVGDDFGGTVTFSVAPGHGPNVSNESECEVVIGYNWPSNTDLKWYGGSNSTIVVTSFTGSDTYFPETEKILSKVRIAEDGEVAINNGCNISLNNFAWTDDSVVEIPALKVDGTFSLAYGQADWTDDSYGAFYVKSLDASGAGSITVGNRFALRIDAVDFAEAPSGTGVLVDLTLTGDTAGLLYGPNGVAGEKIPVAVNGEATEQTLVYDAVKGGLVLYVAPIAFIYDENGNLLREIPAGDNAVMQAAQDFLYMEVGESIKFASSIENTDYHAMFLAGCTYDATTFTYTRKHEAAVAKITVGQKDYTYLTLAAAIKAALDGETVVLLADITLDARVEPNLGAGTTLAIDLGGYTITREGTSGNGSAFDVKSGTVVIKNGTIDCTQDDTAIVKDGVYAITARSGAAVTLQSLTVAVDSQAGACAYPFAGATLAIESGTYSNATTVAYQYKTGWTGMAVNQPNVAQQLITITGGSFYQVNPAEGDDSGLVKSFLASGYKSTYDSATGYWVVSENTGFDGGDGSSTFSIDSDAQAAIAAVLPSGKTLESVALRDPADETSETGMTYAQAYALGLVDLKTGAVKDLKSSISFDADGKVVVSLAESPLEAYTVTLKVYTKSSLSAKWPAEATATYECGKETPFAKSDAAGFYKVEVVISGK